jgi:1-acyl-sn-glycerol-3-phosphate acyltransferase
MVRVYRGAMSLLLFAAFGAGSLVLAPAALLLRRPERFQRVVRAAWLPLLALFRLTRLVTAERGNLPRCEGTLIVSNHPSLIDVVIYVCLVPKTLYVAKHPLRSNFFLGAIVRATSLPDGADLPAVASEYLAKGWNVLVFPEGTRSPAEGLHPFRRGAAHVALESGAPVVCSRLRVSRRILAKGQPPWDMGPEPVVYSFDADEPERFAPLPDETPRKAAIRVTDHFRRRLAADCASSRLDS